MANETILVVDGDTRSRKVLEVGFNKSGYRVVMTETMREALIELERERPDLVVSDTDLPDGDGFELCKRVKEDPDLGYVPFLFLTDESSLPSKIKGLEIGADDYLTRPIYLREVTTRASVLLQKRARKLLSESDVEEFEGELSDITMIDLLQTVEAEDRTGTIHLEREGRDGLVTFRDGNILDAACGKLQGKEAVYRLMLWPSGTFVVRYHDDVREGDHVEPDTQELIVEGIDRLQAWDGLIERLPSLERIYEADYKTLPDLLDEAPDSVGRIARLFDGVRSLRDVIDDSPIDDITTLKVVERLLNESVLRDVTPEGELDDADADEATSHLAEWLDDQTPDKDVDLGLEAENEGQAEGPTEPSDEQAVGNSGDPAATMEDLEKAEQVRRKVEARQLRQQQTGSQETQEGRPGEHTKRGVPQIPGATQPADQTPPPEEATGDSKSDEERDREDTPRAHPASSQDESVEAWLSEGPDVEELEETGSSETRPQFPAVDIGEEIVDAEDAQADPFEAEAPETSADQQTRESVESTSERREQAVERAESVSEEAHPPEKPEARQAAEAPQASEQESEPQDAPDKEPDPEKIEPEKIEPEDIEETPTEALKTDIRPEDLTEELEPAQPAASKKTQAPSEGPLDVERISNNGEVVEAEYDLSAIKSGGASEAAESEAAGSQVRADEAGEADSLAEETPVERRGVKSKQEKPEAERPESEDADFAAPGSQTETTEAQTSDEPEPASEDEGASSTHEMWVDRAQPPEDEQGVAGEQPDEQPREQKEEQKDEVPGLAWGDEPSARPGEGEETGAASQATSDEADFEAPPPEAESPSTEETSSEETTTEPSDDQEVDIEVEADDESEASQEVDEPEAEDHSEPGLDQEAAAQVVEDQPASSETDAAAVEPTEEPSDANERETVPAEQTESEIAESMAEASDVETEEEPEGEPSDDERISEETKEADFFQQGDDLRDTREDDFDWDFEEEETGARWQYWAVGAAVLALAVLGVMGITGSGLFGGGEQAGGEGAQAQAVGADAGNDAGQAGAVAEADTGTKPDTGDDEAKQAGLDKVGAEVVSKQNAKDVVAIARSIAENVEPQQVAQGGSPGDGTGAAGGAGGAGGGGGASVQQVKSLMSQGKLDQAYQALKQARQASPGSSQVARLHVQLGSKFQTGGRDAQARQVYQDYLNNWPNGRFAGEVESIIQNQL